MIATRVANIRPHTHLDRPSLETNLFEHERLTQQTPAHAQGRSGQVRTGRCREGQEMWFRSLKVLVVLHFLCTGPHGIHNTSTCNIGSWRVSCHSTVPHRCCGPWHLGSESTTLDLCTWRPPREPVHHTSVEARTFFVHRSRSSQFSPCTSLSCQITSFFSLRVWLHGQLEACGSYIHEFAYFFVAN